jgi:predicted esterase
VSERLNNILFVCLLLAPYAYSDVIHLSDGGTMEGIVIRESDREITLKVSVGELVVSRSEITSIERTDSVSHASIERQWAGEKKRIAAGSVHTDSKKKKLGLKAGKVYCLNLTLDPEVLRKSNIPPSKAGAVPSKGLVAIYCPAGYVPSKTYPLFIAMRPGVGGNSAAINDYYAFGNEVGIIIAAPQVEREEDEEAEGRYFYTLQTIDFLQQHEVIGDNPVIIGGFSGGGKWALHLGAYGGGVFSGILAVGCNEDFATVGYKEYANRSALGVPVYLLNGTHDETAGIGRSDYGEMINSMRATGFTRVTAVSYKGDHRIPYLETIEALKQLIGKSRQ